MMSPWTRLVAVAVKAAIGTEGKCLRIPARAR